MDFDKAYGAIAVLEVEIRTFANEGYAVKYDFGRKVISWRDNYMWNNNFTRSINENNMAIIKEKLPKSGMLEWMEGYNAGKLAKYGAPTANPSSWRICVKFDDGTDLVASHAKNFPKDWILLRDLIEATTECRFRLR